MKKNMGSADRIIRLIVAAVLIILYVSGIIKGLPGEILVTLGVIFMLTSMISFCPLYLPFGLNTIRRKLHGNKH